jgi:hypothetical protein
MIPATSSAHFSNAASLLDLTTFAPPPVACRAPPFGRVYHGYTTGVPGAQPILWHGCIPTDLAKFR